MRILIPTIAAVIFTVGGYAQTTVQSPKLSANDIEKLKQELMNADRASYRAAQDKGLEGWLTFFDDNAVSIQDKPTVGKDAIRAVYKKMYESPAFVSMEWQPSTGAVLPSGDLVYTEGETLLAFRDAQGKTHVSRGHYISTWKKQKDGSWKIVCDAATEDPA